MATQLQTDNRGLWAEQDKDEFLDYSMDWSDWLDVGDTIATSVWDDVPGLVLSQSSHSDTLAKIWVQGGAPTTWYAVVNRITTAMGRTGDRAFRLFITDQAPTLADMSSALFPNLPAAVDQLKRDRLVLVGQSIGLSVADMTTDFLRGKLLAAEAKAQRELRCYFAPTVIIPEDAPQDEIDALVTAGTRYAQEPAYDYEPGWLMPDSYGYLAARQRPIISVQSIRLVYPVPTRSVFEIPIDWVRLDRKYGQIRLVPSSSAFLAPLSVFLLPAVGAGGRAVPNMIQLRYTAGLSNAARDFPDLIDVVMKMAAVSIIEDAMMPGSGSISADGLSQSLSVDVSKYQDTIDRLMNGPPGSNGGLRTAIHGVVVGFMGGA